MDIERSMETITKDDLVDLYNGSKNRLRQYFINGEGVKWSDLYDIEKPLAVALCQGAALHYYDHKNGIKDFDVWFFYPFAGKHLPYRTVWSWDYQNPKFGHHPANVKRQGRDVDVIVRSIKNYSKNDPINTIYSFLLHEATASARELGKKAVVMVSPNEVLGKTIWYKGHQI